MTFPNLLLPGRHAPLGTQVRDGGVNFAVFSDHATRLELCIFDERGEQELQRYDLHGPHDGVFHGFLLDATAGLIYGLRAHGPYDPCAGHRFNPNKLLLDPYAREIVGDFSWRAEHHGYQLGHSEATHSFDTSDNSLMALKARVAPMRANPSIKQKPHHALHDLVLYEMHVKGFSKAHLDIPQEIRGTYAALAHPAAIAHFKSLGVTALSLLPVHYCLDEPHLAKLGMSNYWGYNTLGFFAANPRLSTTPKNPTQTNAEFRQMVDTLHEHGLEVVLDVVYNHTAEGSESGATLSFRGLDNASWYRLQPDNKTHCENLSGCGNTLNVAHPRVTQFVLDSLRYWADEMGVDGFRFDLAPVLGRTDHGYDAQSAFFTALRQDPILASVHLIAEPWDAGHNGYQLGHFPGRFMEWNDKFRDAVRGYWLKNNVSRGDLAQRFLASSDVFHRHQRVPSASVNFISVHDGYTLADSVSYQHKHNQANGEDNRDGRDNELCENFGVEGRTDDAAIITLRQRVQRAMISTLIFAQGTPMLCAGDEIGNTQHGNNNAYCQDNETGWLKWQNADKGLHAFVTRALSLRKAHPLLHHNLWFSQGENQLQAHVEWFTPAGQPMQAHDWHDSHHAFSCMLSASGSHHRGAGKILICFNPETHEQQFDTPLYNWQLVLDSSETLQKDLRIANQMSCNMPSKSFTLFTITN